jgi:hypothetical protein
MWNFPAVYIPDEIVKPCQFSLCAYPLRVESAAGVRLAVSKSDGLPNAAKLAGAGLPQPPLGWRVARKAELVAMGMVPGPGGMRTPRQNHYAGQAGWDGMRWRRVERCFFLMKEYGEEQDAFLYAGYPEGQLGGPR